MARYPQAGSSQASRLPTKPTICFPIGLLNTAWRSPRSSTQTSSFAKTTYHTTIHSEDREMLAKLAAHPLIVLLAGFLSTVLLIALLDLG
jgi:hypothetical protein